MNRYNNSEEIKRDLKKFNLERQIAMEELKGVKNDVAESLTPVKWVGTAMKAVRKYGIIYIVGKIFRNK